MILKTDRDILDRKMRILGIDPGTATTGFGVLKTKAGGNFELVTFNWIHTNKEHSSQRRLAVIHKEIRAAIRDFQPDVVAIERLFFATNAKTAIAVSEATGVIKLAASSKKVPIAEYTPMEIKKEITGSGRADKRAVKKQIRRLLSIRSPNRKKTHFDDICDALAVAICHARRSMLNSKSKRG